jgi:hypothetical protein
MSDRFPGIIVKTEAKPMYPHHDITIIINTMRQYSFYHNLLRNSRQGWEALELRESGLAFLAVDPRRCQP